MTDIDLPLILIAALVGTASPGPATLAIAGAPINSGPARGPARTYRGIDRVADVVRGCRAWHGCPYACECVGV